jgi:hypothetical protein
MSPVVLTEDECYWTLGALSLLDVQRQVDDDPHGEMTDYLSHHMAAMGQFVSAVTKENRARTFDPDIAAYLTIDFAQNMGDMGDRVLTYLFARVPEPTKDAAPYLLKKFNTMHINGIHIVANEHDFVTLGDDMTEDPNSQKQTIANGRLLAWTVMEKMGIKL